MSSTTEGGRAASAPDPKAHHRFWPARLPHRISVPATSLWHNLAVSAMRYPDKPALVFFDRTTTYADLLAQAERLAAHLRAQGVQDGDRVIVFMQNCPQWIVAYHAVLRANAVVVPVNPMNKADELGHYITDPDARVAICAADLAGELVKANATVPEAERLRHLVVTHYADAIGPAAEIPPAWAGWLRTTHPLPALAGGSVATSISDSGLSSGHTGSGKPKRCFSDWPQLLIDSISAPSRLHCWSKAIRNASLRCTKSSPQARICLIRSRSSCTALVPSRPYCRSSSAVSTRSISRGERARLCSIRLISTISVPRPRIAISGAPPPSGVSFQLLPGLNQRR